MYPVHHAAAHTLLVARRELFGDVAGARCPAPQPNGTRSFGGVNDGTRPGRRPRGFTLIEIMVVLVIIGILASLIVPNLIERADDARVTAARTDVNNLMQALKLYKLDNQRYPTGEQGLQALVVRPTQQPVPSNWKSYLDKLPNDPWGRPYQYSNPGLKGDIDIYSFGADGVLGGEGNNADVGSWQ
jgi:general secretion pathway protein G